MDGVSDTGQTAAAASDKELDVRGLKCPLPVLKTRRAMRDMAAGAVITVLVTDPVSPIDFKHYCSTTGHELLSLEEADGLFTYRIRKVA